MANYFGKNKKQTDEQNSYDTNSDEQSGERITVRLKEIIFLRALLVFSQQINYVIWVVGYASLNTDNGM